MGSTTKSKLLSPIIKEIFNELTLTSDQADFLFSKLKKIELSKGEFLLKPDQKINELFYVHSGCMSNYLIDPEGKEHILQFAVKGWWISDYIALYGNSNTKTVSFIECIKDATLYRITKSDFDLICKELPKVGLFHIGKMEKAFASFQKRILENLTLTAKDRYLNFINTYPNIVSNVKNYHIASFLGITTESLSRIRKELTTV